MTLFSKQIRMYLSKHQKPSNLLKYFYIDNFPNLVHNIFIIIIIFNDIDDRCQRSFDLLPYFYYNPLSYGIPNKSKEKKRKEKIRTK